MEVVHDPCLPCEEKHWGPCTCLQSVRESRPKEGWWHQVAVFLVLKGCSPFRVEPASVLGRGRVEPRRQESCRAGSGGDERTPNPTPYTLERRYS
jgi:hypothetical protein